MMYDSEGKPWNPVLSNWAQELQDKIQKRDNIFHATSICQGCGDMIDKAGKHSSLRNSCPGVFRK